MRLGEAKIEKKYGAKKPIKVWDINVNNLVGSKLIETKANSKHSMGYLGKSIISLVLIWIDMLKHFM